MRSVLLVAMLGAAGPNGQVAKFDTRAPEAQYVTASKFEDVERCLVRTGYPPQVYRQPDRPDEVMIVWLAGGVSAGNAAARVDLKRSGAGVEIKSWLDKKATFACAPQ